MQTQIPKNNYSSSGVRLIRAWAPIFLVLLMAIPISSQAAKILYVQRGLGRDTLNFINILKAEGNDVTVLDDSVDSVDTATNYAANGYELLIVDESISSGSVGDKFRGSPIPVINSEGYLYSGTRSAFNADSGLTGGNYTDAASAAAVNSGAGADYGQINAETNVTIVDSSSPLAAGFSGDVGIFDPPADAAVTTFCGTRTLISGADVVATFPGFAGGATIMGVPEGVENADGTTNMARWVHLPWNLSDASRMVSQDGFFIYDAAVAWALKLPQPTKIYDLMPANGAFMSTNTVITFAVDKTTAGGSAVAQSDIHLTINGTDVINDATITDSGTQWVVSYTNGLPVNETLAIVASATAADGGFSARMANLDTFDLNNFTFEAEDFNFDGGQFIDDPVVSYDPYYTYPPTDPNSYFNRVGATNIDQHEVNFTVTANTATTNEIYRYGDASSLTRLEYVDTYASDDTLLRQKYIDAGMPEYEVRNIADGEWLNYTRTYPTGTFQLYARMSASGAANIEVDSVDNATTTTQNLTKLGNFISSGSGTGGYALVPLTDAGGTPIVVEFTNTAPTTLRMTAVQGGYVANFYMLAPTAAKVNQPPTAQITGPTNYTVVQTGTTMDVTADASDADGSIAKVEFAAIYSDGTSNFIGTATSAPYKVHWTPSTASVASIVTLQAVATDNGGLTAQDSVSVKVLNGNYTIVSTADGSGADAELSEDNDGDSANGTRDSMNTRIIITSGTPNRHEVIGVKFDLGANSSAAASGASINLVSYRSLSARDIHVYAVIDGTVGLDNDSVTPGFTDNTWDDQSSDLLFSTMPGLVWDGSAATRGFTNVVDLGVLNVSLGQGEIWSFTSPTLDTFLQTNADNIVTFLIEQDSDSSGQSRFATREATSLNGGTPTGPTGWFAPYLAFTTGSTAPMLNFTQSGNAVQFTWTGSFKLQVQTNSLTSGLNPNNWVDYPGGDTSGVSVPVDQANGAVFFRLAPAL